MEKKTTGSKKKTGRAKPVAAKAGFTKSPTRRYGCGGKMK